MTKFSVGRKHVDLDGTGTKFLVSKEELPYFVPVSFDANGGNYLEYSRKKYKFLETYEELPETAHSTLNFDGWYTKSEGGDKITTESTVDWKIRNLYAQWKELPYTELEYIQFTGTQYINTDIIPTNHFTEVKYYVPSYVNDGHILGTSSGASYYHFTEYSYKYYWGRNGSEGNGGSWSSSQHIIKMNYGSNYQVILDGTTLGSGSQIYSGNNLWIGRRDSSTNYQGYIYYCQITDKSTNVLVLDLIPVKDENDIVCMYDKVSETYFYNQGSGSFIAGPEV